MSIIPCIVLTGSRGQVLELHDLLGKSPLAPEFDYDRHWCWLLLEHPSPEEEIDITGNRNPHSPFDLWYSYPLLPIYTFQGFKHHFVK
jgi:hypothetical protein